VRVTFDTNTLDKACRPERFHKDPNQPIYQKVHNALKTGTIHGVYSVTLLTIEGIIKTDRAKIMAGARLEQRPEQEQITRNADLPDAIRNIVGTADVTTMNIEFKAVEPDRHPPHPEFIRRVQAAKALGFRVLQSPPRIGAFQYTDPDGAFYVSDEERGDLATWIEKINKVVRAINARGVGFAQVEALGARLAAAGDDPATIWFKALASATNIHDERAVQRAFSEWADGDSIASHVAYSIDVFCTSDRGGSNAGASVLDNDNRQWLTTTYGIRFMSIEELAAAL
jgi:hypothetical protein